MVCSRHRSERIVTDRGRPCDRTHTGGKHGYHYSQKKGIHFAWFVLIGVLLMMGLCRGGINSGMGLFFQPISADMHIGVGEVAMMSSISALITMFWSPFAGRLLDKFDIRIITVVAVAIQAGCFAALSAGRRGVGLLRAGRHHGVRLGVRHAAGRPHDDQPLVQR